MLSIGSLISDEKHFPQYKVLIGGKELSAEKYSVIAIDVNLSSSVNANDCQIVFAGKYDSEQSEVGGGLISKLAVGKRAEVMLGYKSPSSVFLGYINSVNVDFGAGGVTVTAQCIDARGLLMKNYSWKTHQKETYSQIVNEMLKPLSEFVKKITVSVPEPKGDAAKEMPKVKDGEDDFRYLVNLAEQTKSSFCVINGELKFVADITDKGRVAGEYTWGKDLLSFTRQTDLSNQVGSVIVHGTEPDTLKTFEAKSAPLSGRGKTGAQLSKSVRNKVIEIHSAEVKTREEAQKLADATLLKHSITLCRGTAQVLGSEKLFPASKVKFDGLDPDVDGEYIITGVHHRFDGGGFVTDIEFSGYTV